MAVSEVNAGIYLKLKLYTGDDPVTGDPMYRIKTFKGVKESALNQDLFDIANSLAGLQYPTLSAVTKETNVNLISS